jgi:putative iron-only hydrogenase system regulator
VSKRVGFVGILVENRESGADEVNKVLSACGDIIIARTGVPYKQKNCCVITLIIDATTDELGAMTGRLGNIKGISVKSALSKEREG